MIIISDTNILSSLALADGFDLLFKLFSRADIKIPPAVHQELKVGLERQQIHLEIVLEAIDSGKLQILHLSSQEEEFAKHLPRKLNAGESEAIVLSQTRKVPLLSNDKRAINYCKINQVEVIDLPTILNLFWTRQIIKKKEVNLLIQKMKERENLKLTESQRNRVFAPPPPPPPPRRKRRRGKRRR